MHQVVAGSRGNTIDLALPSTGVNEEYVKVSAPLEPSTKALNTTSGLWKVLPHTPHIPIYIYICIEICQRNKHPPPSPLEHSALSSRVVRLTGHT